jgi:hypothetical protein
VQVMIDVKLDRQLRRGLVFGTKFREELRSLVGEAMRGVSLEASLRITIVIAFEI